MTRFTAIVSALLFWAATIEAASVSGFIPVVAGGSTTGAPPDSPAARIDPNTTSSPYAGVVAVNMVVGVSGGSGVAISPYHILTARHVVSLDVGNPSANTIRVNYGSNNSQVLTVSGANVSLQPAPGGFPYNDLAIITLDTPLAAGVPIYQLYRQVPTVGQVVTFAGYGRGGSGDAGYTVDFDPNVKRVGSNVADLYSANPAGADGQGRISAVFVFDLDNADTANNPQGPNGYTGLQSLGNDVEATYGGGDSGGPTFVDDGGVLKVFGVNSFILSFSGNPGDPNYPFEPDPAPDGPAPPFWGSGGGGALLYPYLDWIDGIINPVPEPSHMLLAAAAAGVAFLRLRRGRSAA